MGISLSWVPLSDHPGGVHEAEGFALGDPPGCPPKDHRGIVRGLGVDLLDYAGGLPKVGKGRWGEKRELCRGVQAEWWGRGVDVLAHSRDGVAVNAL